MTFFKEAKVSGPYTCMSVPLELPKNTLGVAIARTVKADKNSVWSTGALNRSESGVSPGEEGKMPQFPWSTAMTANQLGLNPLAGWQYEYLPWPAQVIILVRSTTTGNRITVYTGSETIQERTPVQAGGTAGTTPSELNTPAISFQAAGGDRLKLVIDEVSGGTPTVDGVIIANPLF